MVVELLTFTVAASELEEWLRVEEANWSRFLERQPGFVRKEMWRSRGAEDQIHAVIWWESLEHWHAVPADALAEVVEAMGPYEKVGVMQDFDVLREC